MSKNHRLLGMFVSILVLSTSLSAIHAQPAAESLMRYVSTDAGVCAEMTGLKRLLPEIEKSPLAERIRQSTFYRDWRAGDDFERLESIGKQIRGITGKPMRQFIEELLSDRIVFVVYPVAGNAPQTLLLATSENEGVLETALEAWERSPNQQRIELNHAGVAFSRMSPTKGTDVDKKSRYYVTFGRVLALSDSEAAIHRVIDLRTSPPEEKRRDLLADVPAFRQAKESLSHGTVASIYFNPRAWDAVIAQRPSADKGGPDLGALWKQIESVIVGVRLDDGIVCEVVTHYDASQLPAAWTQFVERTGGANEFFRRVPRNAFVAFAGKHDLAGLSRAAYDKTDPKIRGRVDGVRTVSRAFLQGLDPLTDVFPRLAPEWGAYLVPRDQPGGDAMPFEGLLALSLKPGPDANEFRKTLDNGLQSAVTFLVGARNAGGKAKPAAMKSSRGAHGTVHWVEGLGPHQPAYAVTQDYIVLASSPKLIERFVTSKPDAGLQTGDRYRTQAATHFPNENQIAFVDLVGIRRYISTHRQFFIDDTVKKKGLDAKTADTQLARFEELLAMFDTGFVAASVGGERVRFVFGATLEK